MKYINWLNPEMILKLNNYRYFYVNENFESTEIEEKEYYKWDIIGYWVQIPNG